MVTIFGFHKMWGISLQDQWALACQAGFICMELHY